MTKFIPLALLCVVAAACGGGDGSELSGDGRSIDQTANAQTEFPAGFETCGTLEEECDTRCTGSFENVECTGTLSGNFDNVIVPPGATCDISQALITGNLIVEEKATATIGATVFVCGDLKGDKANSVQTSSTRVCSNLQVDESGTADIRAGTVVLKNAEFKKSSSISVANTSVCADAQFVENDVVSITPSAPLMVAQNCKGDENNAANFSGIDVRGDNDGCVASP